MSPDNKIVQLITKLIRLTSEEKIAWELKDPPRNITSGTDDIIPLYFEAKYKDKWVAIYEERYKGYDPDHDSQYWTNRIVFAVLDSSDRVLWETGLSSAALHDLWKTVREKAVQLDQLLDDLLDDDEI